MRLATYPPAWSLMVELTEPLEMGCSVHNKWYG